MLPPFPRALAQDDPPATHVVQIGETLSEIAAAYGISTAELMAINGITDADQIDIGQELLLPANARSSEPLAIEIPTHTVQAGETLSQIAEQHGVSLTRLMYLNGIDDPNAVYEGQVLRLPAAVTEAETTPTAEMSGPTAQTETPETVTAEAPTATTTKARTATASPTEEPSPTVTPSATARRRPSSHVIQAGETLSEIAELYDVEMDALMNLNGIQNADAIYVGQELSIPGAPTPTPEDTPTPTVTSTPTITPTPEPGTATPEPTATPIERSSNPIASLNQTYTVRRDDTLNHIARRLGIDEDALRRINRLRPGQSLVIGSELILPATAEEVRITTPEQEYVVQPGDTLSVIANTFGLKMGDLMAANYIGNPNTISAGQRLVIPDPAPEDEATPVPTRVGPERSGYYYYTVQQGDTLSELAKQFNSTLLAILDYNGLPNAETVYRGVELRVPFGPPPMPVRQPPVPTSGTSFMVSLSRQQCWVLQGKYVLYAWQCSTGYGEYLTRTGNFAVQSKIENAKSSAYQLDMPYWLGIYYVGHFENGIHGLPVRWSTGKKIWTELIGQPATFGCAMLGDEDAAELFRLAYIGMPVYIVN
jgi:LysM repeat protein